MKISTLIAAGVLAFGFGGFAAAENNSSGSCSAYLENVGYNYLGPFYNTDTPKATIAKLCWHELAKDCEEAGRVCEISISREEGFPTSWGYDTTTVPYTIKPGNIYRNNYKDTRENQPAEKPFWYYQITFENWWPIVDFVAERRFVAHGVTVYVPSIDLAQKAQNEIYNTSIIDCFDDDCTPDEDSYTQNYPVSWSMVEDLCPEGDNTAQNHCTIEAENGVMKRIFIEGCQDCMGITSHNAVIMRDAEPDSHVITLNNIRTLKEMRAALNALGVDTR